jgi:SAM-dependent methyltransferase
MTADTLASSEERAARLGRPSRAWAFGQNRRLDLINRYAPLQGKRILDAGCGVGMYLRHFQEFSPFAVGIDLEVPNVAEARLETQRVLVSSAEAVPFAGDSFDIVLSHEVLEHVADDRQAVAEAIRVLRPHGRLVIFAPNRLYPFETHGFYWRGRYHFGNIPLINWLPNRLRNRLCPHVRAYTPQGLAALWKGLPVRVVVSRQVYPGYDKLMARRPGLGRILRVLTYTLERTPLRVFGLSHVVVLEKSTQEQ